MENNKRNYIIGGIIVGTVAIGGIFFWLFGRNKEKLSPWLEEYIKEVEAKLKTENKDKLCSLDTCAYVFNLFEEVNNFFYLNENSELEEERVNALGDNKKYEELVHHSLANREEYMERARKVVEGRLGISIHNLQENVQKSDKTLFKNLVRTCQKKFPDLPEISPDVLKKAYAEYVDSKLKIEKTAMQQFNIARVNPDYLQLAYEIMVFNNFMLKDRIYKEYKIHDKHFEQLIEKYKLNEDEEIKKLRDELSKVA
jgi:hypothetical protein